MFCFEPVTRDSVHLWPSKSLLDADNTSLSNLDVQINNMCMSVRVREGEYVWTQLLDVTPTRGWMFVRELSSCHPSYFYNCSNCGAWKKLPWTRDVTSHKRINVLGLIREVKGHRCSFLSQLLVFQVKSELMFKSNADVFSNINYDQLRTKKIPNFEWLLIYTLQILYICFYRSAFASLSLFIGFHYHYFHYT
jgi:hypothetical protein